MKNGKDPFHERVRKILSLFFSKKHKFERSNKKSSFESMLIKFHNLNKKKYKKTKN
jgi:hypothetical protein